MVAGRGDGTTSPDALIAELLEARSEFEAALGRVDAELLTAPGLVGEWSARELIAHLGYWAGHATEAIHHAEGGRLAEFEPDGPQVEERNAIVARVARETNLATVRQREAAAFDALVERLRSADPALLAERDRSGDTLESAVREDGPEHYLEHAAHVRAWFGAEDEPREPDDDADDDASQADGD